LFQIIRQLIKIPIKLYLLFIIFHSVLL